MAFLGENATSRGIGCVSSRYLPCKSFIDSLTAPDTIVIGQPGIPGIQPGIDKLDEKVIGDTIIKIPEGEYDENLDLQNFASSRRTDISGEKANYIGLVFVGDTREFCGATYMNDGVNTLVGGSNLGNQTGRVVLTQTGNTITVEVNGGNPDFEAAGLQSGDTVIISDNSRQLFERTVNTVSGNTITYSGSQISIAGTDNEENSNCSITLCPNVVVRNTRTDKSTMVVGNNAAAGFVGIRFKTDTGTTPSGVPSILNDGKIVLQGCVMDDLENSSTGFANQGEIMLKSVLFGSDGFVPNSSNLAIVGQVNNTVRAPGTLATLSGSLSSVCPRDAEAFRFFGAVCTLGRLSMNGILNNTSVQAIRMESSKLNSDILVLRGDWLEETPDSGDVNGVALRATTSELYCQDLIWCDRLSIGMILRSSKVRHERAGPIGITNLPSGFVFSNCKVGIFMQGGSYVNTIANSPNFESPIFPIDATATGGNVTTHFTGTGHTDKFQNGSGQVYRLGLRSVRENQDDIIDDQFLFPSPAVTQIKFEDPNNDMTVVYSLNAFSRQAGRRYLITNNVARGNSIDLIGGGTNSGFQGGGSTPGDRRAVFAGNVGDFIEIEGVLNQAPDGGGQRFQVIASSGVIFVNNPIYDTNDPGRPQPF